MEYLDASSGAGDVVMLSVDHHAKKSSFDDIEMDLSAFDSIPIMDSETPSTEIKMDTSVDTSHPMSVSNTAAVAPSVVPPKLVVPSAPTTHPFDSARLLAADSMPPRPTSNKRQRRFSGSNTTHGLGGVDPFIPSIGTGDSSSLQEKYEALYSNYIIVQKQLHECELQNAFLRRQLRTLADGVSSRKYSKSPMTSSPDTSLTKNWGDLHLGDPIDPFGATGTYTRQIKADPGALSFGAPALAVPVSSTKSSSDFMFIRDEPDIRMQVKAAIELQNEEQARRSKVLEDMKRSDIEVRKINQRAAAELVDGEVSRLHHESLHRVLNAELTSKVDRKGSSSSPLDLEIDLDMRSLSSLSSHIPTLVSAPARVLHESAAAAAAAAAARIATSRMDRPRSGTSVSIGGDGRVGRWRAEEHARFIAGMRDYGYNWDSVAAAVGTRTIIQVRSHAQKYFKKLRKEKADLALAAAARAGLSGRAQITAAEAAAGTVSTSTAQERQAAKKSRSHHGTASGSLEDDLLRFDMFPDLDFDVDPLAALDMDTGGDMSGDLDGLDDMM